MTTAQEKQDKDKEKTDCEKFVDDMVALAAGNEGLRNGPDFWQGMSTAGDLVDSFVPPDNGITLNSATRGFFGNLVGHQPFIGVGTSGVGGVPTGFQPELIAGGQNAAVGRHVAANAALTLNGLGFGTNVQNFFDGLQTGRDLETAAEIAGNDAGRDVGRLMSDFHNEKLSASQLKESLMERLCE